MASFLLNPLTVSTVRASFGWFLVVVAASACSLNPQIDPPSANPGVQADAGLGANPGTGGSGAVFGAGGFASGAGGNSSYGGSAGTAAGGNPSSQDAAVGTQEGGVDAGPPHDAGQSDTAPSGQDGGRRDGGDRTKDARKD